MYIPVFMCLYLDTDLEIQQRRRKILIKGIGGALIATIPFLLFGPLQTI